MTRLRIYRQEGDEEPVLWRGAELCTGVLTLYEGLQFFVKNYDPDGTLGQKKEWLPKLTTDKPLTECEDPEKAALLAESEKRLKAALLTKARFNKRRHWLTP